MAKRKKEIISGQLVEVVIYTAPEPRDNERTRAEKSRITSEAQKKLNRKTARRNCERIIAANFKRKDLFVTLTFDDCHYPEDRKAAEKEMRKFVRLLRGVRKGRGCKLRYIYTIEDLHGKGRIHIHSIINATGNHDFEDIRSLWNCGINIDIKQLDVAAQALTESEAVKTKWHGALAAYFTKEKKPVGARAWICSLNLKKPVVKTSFVRNSETIRIPKEAEVIEREEKQNEWGTFQYVKYWMPDKTRRRKSRKSKKEGKRNEN